MNLKLNQKCVLLRTTTHTLALDEWERGNLKERKVGVSLHSGILSISLGWHYCCHAGGCRRDQGMQGQERSSRNSLKSIETPNPMSCDGLNSQHGKLKWLNFLSLHHIDGCVTLLFFQCLPHDITSNTNSIPESGALSLGDSATGLFCCSTLVIYWLPRFTGLVDLIVEIH